MKKLSDQHGSLMKKLGESHSSQKPRWFSAELRRLPAYLLIAPRCESVDKTYVERRGAIPNGTSVASLLLKQRSIHLE